MTGTENPDPTTNIPTSGPVGTSLHATWYQCRSNTLCISQPTVVSSKIYPNRRTPYQPIPHLTTPTTDCRKGPTTTGTATLPKGPTTTGTTTLSTSLGTTDCRKGPTTTGTATLPKGPTTTGTTTPFY
jgi:hypothetical protein